MNDERIEELIESYLANRLSDAEKAELANWLDEDSTHQAIFREALELEYCLIDQMPLRQERVRYAKLIGLPLLNRQWEHLSIAAMFFLCVVLTWLLLGSARNSDDLKARFGSMARLTQVGEDAVFSEGHDLPTRVGSYLSKGWIELDKGTIEILFHSGATVQLTGPATFGINTEKRAYLDFGQIVVHAPEAARDFVVATESMEVVDLGTRFEVMVDQQSGESSVSVLEGLVDLHLGSRGVDRMIRPLEAGYAARVDAFGEIVEITGGPSSHPIGEAAAPAILAHWKLDGVGAKGEIEDASSSQMDGSWGAGKQPQLVPGLLGKALEFSGNEFVDLSEHVSTLAQLDAFTFAAWVRDPEDPLAMVFSLSGDSERHRVQFYLARGFVRFGWQDGLHFDSISGRVDGWQSGRWYHVAVTVEGSVARLYRDGEMIASGSVGSNIGTLVSNPSLVKNVSHAYLGWLVDGRQGEESAPQSYAGQLDDVQLYSGALNQEGIQSIFKHPGRHWKPPGE